MDRFKLVCFVFCTVLFVQCRCSDWYTLFEQNTVEYDEEEVSDQYIPEPSSTEQTDLFPVDTLTSYTDYDVNENSVPREQFPTEDTSVQNSVPREQFPTEDTSVQNSSENEIQQELSESSEENVPKPKNPEVNLSIENLISTVSNLTTELIKQQNQIADLEKTNKQLQEKIEFIEQKTKTNSLIFFNVPESEHETHKTTLTRVLYVLNKVMKVKTRADEIAVALRAESEDGATYRPIMVRFVNFETKMRVLAAKPRLQRSHITVEPDYSEGVARERAQLVPYMMAARAQGARTYMLYNRLVINGVKFSLQELQTMDQISNEYELRLPFALSKH